MFKNDIVNVRIDWMERWANNPRIIVDLQDNIRSPWPFEHVPVWENRNGLHRADDTDSPQVNYFYSDGKPTQGFAGARMFGTFKNGDYFSYRGGWSSRAACVNAEYPDRRVVDVVVGSRATAIDANYLTQWVGENKPDIELAWVDGGDDAYTLMPLRNGTLKNSCSHYRIMEIVT